MDLRRRTFGPHPTAQDWRDASKADIEQALAADVIRRNPKLYAGYDEDAVKFVRNTMGPTKWDLLLAAQALGLAPQGTYLYPDERRAKSGSAKGGGRQHATMRSRFWYFAELNERGGVRDRFGPFISKHAAASARKRAKSLFREKRLDQVRSSIERFPSNVPNWMKNR
jgi:hypothetical protein